MGLLMYKDIPYSGGGTDVEANPSGTATEDLTKLGIDETIYDVVDNDAVHSDDVGVANGVAELDSNGKVPSSQLPTYPTVNNGTLTIKKNGTTIATFTANQSGNSNANISVPTTPSDIDAAAESDVASTQTATGNPLTLSGVAPINAEKLEVELEPKQDLHGQSYPYVGGAGKNKLPVTSAEIKAGNLVTFSEPLPSGTYSLSFNATRTSGTNVESSVVVYDKDDTAYTARAFYPNTGNRIKIENQTYNNGVSRIYFYSFAGNWGYSQNYTLTLTDIQLEVGSTSSDFSPYSNICPISGYDSVSVDDVGKNLFGGDAFADKIATDVTGAVKDTTNKTISYSASNISDVVLYDKFKPNTRYTFITNQSSGVANLAFGYTDGTVTVIRDAHVTSSTVGKTIAKLYGYYSTGSTVLNYEQTGLFEGAINESDFAPYAETTASVTFGQTVYGGKSDFVEGGTEDNRTYGTASFSQIYVRSGNANVDFAVFSVPDAWTVVNYMPKDLISNMARVTGKTFDTETEVGGLYVYDTGGKLLAVSVPKGSTLQEVQTLFSGMTYCYEKATPAQLSTPPAPLRLLKGTNNLSTDGTSMTVGYQPDNVIGELKEDLQQHTEMEWLQVLLNGVQSDYKDIQLQDSSSIASRFILADLEVFKHRFMLFELYRKQNDTITYTNASLMLSISSLVEATYGYNASLGFNNGVNANFNVRIIYFQGNYEIMVAIYTDASSPLTNIYARARLVD